MKKSFIITADWNDGDYVIGVVTITEKEFNKLLPVIDAIKNFKPYVCRWGINYNNWDEDPDDSIGQKSPEKLYSNIDPKLINEFREKFIYEIDTPENCSIHNIISIQEVILGGKLVTFDYYESVQRAGKDKKIKQYFEEESELRKQFSRSKPICDFTKEEKDAYDKYNNLWKKYN